MVAGAAAQPFGVEMNNTLMPASGAMGGVSIAAPQDFLSGLNGNPATLAQFRGTQFTFSGAWDEATFNLHQTAPIPAAGVTPYGGKSGSPGVTAGNIGVVQDLTAFGLPATFGVGFITAAGGGADFRHFDESNGTNTVLQVFEMTSAVGLQLTDRLAAGAGLTMGIGLFDPPFVDIGGATTDYAIRGSFGLTFQATEATTLGCYYRTSESFQFDNAVRFTPGPFAVNANVAMDLPRNVGLGIANRALCNGRLLIAADFLFKNWDDAALFRSVYNDQWCFQFGTQYTIHRLKLRAGYVFAQNPIDANPIDNDVGGVVPPGGPLALRYTQGLLAVTSPHRISAGFGLSDVMMRGLDLDFQAGGMLRDTEQLGPATTTSICAYWVGAGMTWRFR